MPPRTPKLAADAAADYRFPSIEDLIADAAKATEDLPDYVLPLGGEHVITVPRPDGATYLQVLAAQRRGAEDLMLQLLIPDKGDHKALLLKMKGAPMRLADTIIGNILSYYYGTGLLSEAREGNSPAS